MVSSAYYHLPPIYLAWNDGLVGTSLNIASSTERRIRVMAGPGTGKSFAMKRRVARLLEEGCAPERILAVTLTRNAARELVKDLKDLNIAGCERVRVGTLHSYCFRLLQHTGYLASLGRTPRLLMQFEDKPLVKDIVQAGGFGGVRECRKQLKAFEAAWARMQHEQPGWPADPVDRRFSDVLRDWLTFHKVLRVGELTPLALTYLKNNPASPELSAYDHIVVDEYQDLNKAEQDLIALLAQNAHCAIVGDEDQSIYGFRHAHPEGIKEFSSVHPGTQDEQLDECRRCPKLVVQLADELIRKNHPPATPARLQVCPTNAAGAVEIIQWNDLAAEVSGLSAFVKAAIDGGRPPEDFMILCPSREVGRSIRNALRDVCLIAHSFYAEDALEDLRAQQAFSLLRLLVSPDDRVALRFLLGVGTSGWLAGQYAKLRRHCEQTGEAPRSILDSIVAGTFALNGVVKLVSRYTTIQYELAALGTLNGHALADRLFPATEEWAQPVRLIIDRALDAGTLPADIHSELVEALTQPEVPAEGGYVRIMSLHKSKGLSSPIVIVAACVQGIIPRLEQPTASDDDKRRTLAEQRRLFYVAMTRARERLILSSAVQWPRSDALGMGVSLKPRVGNRAIGHAHASQFLHELGPCAPAGLRGDDWLRRNSTAA